MLSIGHRTGLFDLHRALTADGVYLMQEIGATGRLEDDLTHPMATLLYTVSCMHCMTVSLARGGEGLGAMWEEGRVREYLGAAGFRSITVRRLAHDVQNVGTSSGSDVRLEEAKAMDRSASCRAPRSACNGTSSP
jgi:hypothetical protein